MLKNQQEQTLATMTLQIGKWKISPQTNELINGHTVKRIEPKAMTVLLYLLEHNTKVISTQELLEKVWGNIVVTPNTVRRIIAQLRKVLDDENTKESYIRTIPRAGYQLILPKSLDSRQTNSIKPKIFKTKTGIIAFMLALIVVISTLVFHQINKKTEPLYSTTPVTSLQGRELNPTVSTKHQAIVFSYFIEEIAQYELRLKYFSSAESIPLRDAQGSVFSPAWSIKDKLAFANIANGQCQIFIADILPNKTYPEQSKLNNIEQIFDCGPNGFPQLTWSNSGDILFFNSKNANDSKYQLNQYHLTDKRAKVLDFNIDSHDEFFKIVASSQNDIFALLSFNGQNSRIWRYNTNESKPKLLFEHQGFNESISWCQHGNKLMFGYQQQLWQFDDDFQAKAIEGLADDFSYLNCPMDAEKIYYVARKRSNSLVSFTNQLLPKPSEIKKQLPVITDGYHFRSTYNEFAPTWANLSRKLAFYSDRSGRWQLYLSNENQQLTSNSNVSFSQKPYAIRWSPNDEHLLLIVEKQLMLYNVETNNFTQLVNLTTTISDVAWANDNTGFYYVLIDDSKLYHFNLSTKISTVITTLSNSNENISLLARVPHQPWLFYLKGNKADLWRFDLATKTSTLFSDHLLTSGYLQVFKQGIYFYKNNVEKSGTYFYDFDTQEVKQALVEFGDQGVQLSVSYDQQIISYVSVDGYQADIKVLTPK